MADSSLFEEFLDACAEDNIKSVKSLLSQVDPGQDNNEALTVACTWGNLGIVKILLTDTRVQPTVGAFVEAASEGHLDIVKLLLTDDRLNSVECAVAALKFDEVKHRELIANFLLTLIPISELVADMDIDDEY